MAGESRWLYLGIKVIVMKKIITLKKQHMLSFIPFLNTLVLFAWIYNYLMIVRDSKIFIKSLFVLLATTIPIAVLQCVLQNILRENMDVVTLINIIATLLIPFCMARGLISFQRRYLLDRLDS